MKKEAIKDFYTNFADKIVEKRFRSEYKVRSYAHVEQYKSILSKVEPGMKVLDAGCGEGVLAVMMAKKGAAVTGVDISVPNIAAAKEFAAEENAGHIDFFASDLERLPFEADTFDLVVSSHVLEHLPDFDRGLEEIMRVTKKRAVVAIPTIINPCSWVQVGGGMFWLKGPRSFLAMPIGFIKMLIALVMFREGVNEGYVGSEAPHVFRFPWILKLKMKKYGFELVEQEASSISLPFFSSLLPLSKILNRFRKTAFWNNLGYGTTYVIEKIV